MTGVWSCAETPAVPACAFTLCAETTTSMRRANFNPYPCFNPGPLLRMNVRNRQSQRGCDLGGLQQRGPISGANLGRLFRNDDRVPWFQNRSHRVTRPKSRVVLRGNHGPVGANHENAVLVGDLSYASTLAQVPFRTL